MAERHEFNADIKQKLAIRVCYKCSKCQRPTAGPSNDDSGKVMVGVAAHICAASPGGPRYDPNQSELDRKAITNGIWLCANCAKCVDDDDQHFTVAVLREMKREAESQARKELDLPPGASHRDDWQSLQISRISSFGIGVKIRAPTGELETDAKTVGDFTQGIHHLVVRAFSHTCVTTPYDDFCYVMEFVEDSRETEPGYVPFNLWLHCHITTFVGAFERLARFYIIGEGNEPTDIRWLPGRQETTVRSCLDKFAPNRICRTGPTTILLERAEESRIGMTGHFTTSMLFRLLAAAVNSHILIWDDADLCPEHEKVLSTFMRINDDGFSWPDFRVDRSDPEKWEYVAAAKR